MGPDDPPTTPAAPSADPEATTSLLDAAIAEAEGDPARRVAEDDALKAFASLQYALLDELREALAAVNASAEGILRTIFDPSRCHARSAELERLLVGAADDAQPAAAAPEGPAVEGPIESIEPSEDVTGGCPPDTQPKATAPSLRERVLGVVALPLRLLAAPLAAVPRPYRALVGIFALTLFLWTPAVRWLATEVIANRRVRPLEVAELDALSEALRPPVEEHAKPEGKSAKAKPQGASGGH